MPLAKSLRSVVVPYVVMCLALAAPRADAAMPLGVVGLRVEYEERPIGIDVRAPRLSWKLASERRGTAQSAYAIQVATSERDLAAAHDLVWDSGRVESDESIQRVYEGAPLRSGRRYVWRVRVWDEKGAASEWSAPSSWETGLLEPSDWTANWIEPDLEEDTSKPQPSPMLRGAFTVKGAVREARAYATARGLYELHLNGKRVGDQVFTPGWTSYKHHLQYQTYDVTSLLNRGENVAGAVLGDGWYRGVIGFSGQRNVYGDRLALLVQIRVTYEDGRTETFGTDRTWKATTGPILTSEIYNGETYDARLEKPGWDAIGYSDSDWSGVRVADYPKDDLVAPAGPPVRKIQELRPIKVLKSPAGQTIVDMGQNMVGWVRLKARGPAGTTVTLRHAEVLDKQGNLYTENLRAAAEQVRYTLKGSGVEVFEPHFSFQGFRYVAVDGYPGEVTTDSLTGVVIHSDMAPVGEFETSSPLVNQLQHNIVWGQKGNFLDVPTDCPQRDERLGWTGDAQVFSRTAAFNMDVAGFYTKWLADVAADQGPDGNVPFVVPDVISRDGKMAGGSAGWADVAVIIPWNMYLAYGDRRILERQYPSMTKWVDYMRSRAGDDLVWDGDFHFGDWLAFATTRPDYPGATTGKDLIATAFFAHSTDLVRRTALVLDRRDDAAKYGELFDRIKEAFRREFVTERGRVGENTQTAYALALQFDLLPEALRPLAAENLVRDVREQKHLTTGFLGTPYLCHVLSRYGYLDEAYMLLEREEYPSWLYPVKQGATTIWERWDGQRPDGTFQDAGMNSFNHYAYGAIGEWMYRVVAGVDVDPREPGYKHVLIAPRPGGSLTRARASQETMYGLVSSSWEKTGDRFTLTIEIPANTHATVRLPKAQAASVPKREGVTDVRQDGDSVVVEVGSGQYRFAY